MRKLLTVELLTVKRIDSVRFVREEEVSAMVASIWQESGRGPKCVDMKKRLSSLTQHITCKMFAGRTYFDNELNGGSSLKEMVEEMFVVAGTFCIGDFIPSLDCLDLHKVRRRMQIIHKIFNGFAKKVIDEHMLDNRKGKKDRVKDLVDVMLEMADLEGQMILRTHIKAMILDILNGGSETSVMSELLRNPATLARAQEEMDSVVGRNRRIKESDIMKLDYLRCVVKETFRLRPPVPLLIPHESREGCSVGGYFIPPKTRLLVNVWAMGRDENVWKDACHFKPERFMGSNKDVRGQDFDLLPFGTGRRGCPAITMGISVSELALAQLIHCFDWAAEGEIDIGEQSGTTVPRKNSLFACPKWRLTTEFPVTQAFCGGCVS